MKSDEFAKDLRDYENHSLVVNTITNIFGLILFTNAHPYVIKCLRDDDFWNALDEKSGNRWNIFSIKPQEAKIRNSQFSKGGLGHLNPIWEEPNYNKYFIEALELEDTSVLPVFVVLFKKGEEIENCLISIDGDSVDEVYHSIDKIIDKTTRVVSSISEENLQNSNEIFNLLKSELSSQNFIRRLKKVDKVWRFIKDRVPGL